MSLSVKLNTFGKFLDQPGLTNKINKAMPWVLSGMGAGYIAYDSFRTPKEQKKKNFIQNVSVVSFTIASAFLATKGLKIRGKEIIEGLAEECHHDHHYNHEIEEILEKVKDNARIKSLIAKVQKGHILWPKQIKELAENLKDKGGIKELIPDAHTHVNPFGELLKLSWLGLIPVLGGMTGGVIGDVLSKDNWKKKFPDKIKEGSYQYLNNIFLCNVGAGLAMFAMNKANVKNKAIRSLAMLSGVVLVGLVAGSAIANFIGKNLINPIFDKNKRFPKDFNTMIKNLNSERHPEAVDLSLHIDDIASVGFLTGFKWIGPILPMLYSVSAYRAGIGYRNGNE